MPLQQKRFGGCCLYQIPSVRLTQCMGYVFVDTHGNLIVIDGGTAAEADLLEAVILSRAEKVSAWFVTHAHLDHIDAVTEVLNRQRIPVETLYYRFPDAEWIVGVDKNMEPSLRQFLQAIRTNNIKTSTIRKGETIRTGDFAITCLSDPLQYLSTNVINATSLILRVDTLDEPVLFLADAETVNEQSLLIEYPDLIRCPVVQMAHHGQNGVSEKFYQAVKPEVCLWPTPAWLWDNNRGNQGKNTGPWNTLKTRRWMQKLHVKNYVAKDKLIVIE